jgi:hypothetical protein
VEIENAGSCRSIATLLRKKLSDHPNATLLATTLEFSDLLKLFAALPMSKRIDLRKWLADRSACRHADGFSPGDPRVWLAVSKRVPRYLLRMSSVGKKILLRTKSTVP